MRLMLVRHPKPDCEPGLCYGSLDLACKQDALADAIAALRPLSRGRKIISSPSRRAVDLARGLNGDDVVMETRLRELDFGHWEGRKWSELGRVAIDTWRLSLPDGAAPGGESLTNLALRCRDWLTTVQDREDLMVITHAGPIRVLRSLHEGRSLLHYFSTPVQYAEPIYLK